MASDQSMRSLTQNISVNWEDAHSLIRRWRNSSHAAPQTNERKIECVSVCVCVRERERERHTKIE
jgi:hypothetical protein